MKQLILLFLFFPGLTLAQVELSLDDCRKMALKNSQELRMADLQQQKAAYEVRMYRADYFPKMSLVGWGFYHQRKYTYTLLSVIKLQLNLREIYSAGVQLEQPVYWGGKIRSAHQMAKIGEEMAAEEVALRRSELLLEVEQAYWQLLRVEEQLLAVQKYRTLLYELLKNLREANNVGMVTYNETLKAIVRCDEADLMIQKAQNGRTLACMNLCRLVGLELQTELSLQDSLSERIDYRILEMDSTILSRPDYDLLKYEVELNRRQVALQRADFLPQIGVSVGYGYSGGLKLNGEGDQGRSLMALATLKIPIFYGGAGRNRIRAARMDEEISRLNLNKSAQLMQLEIASARCNLQDAQSRVEMAKKALAQAEENLKVCTDQYQVGMENLTTLLEAQAQWQEVYSQWIDAKAQLQLGISIYLKAVGKLE